MVRAQGRRGRALVQGQGLRLVQGRGQRHPLRFRTIQPAIGRVSTSRSALRDLFRSGGFKRWTPRRTWQALMQERPSKQEVVPMRTTSGQPRQPIMGTMGCHPTGRGICYPLHATGTPGRRSANDGTRNPLVGVGVEWLDGCETRLRWALLGMMLLAVHHISQVSTFPIELRFLILRNPFHLPSWPFRQPNIFSQVSLNSCIFIHRQKTPIICNF